MNQFDLPHRAARCVATANAGDAVILMITEEQREEATRLVGDVPVITANREQTKQFLMFYAQPLKRKR
jgi:hypothetical protein